MAALARNWVSETVRHQVHDKGPMHVTAKPGIARPTRCIDSQGLEDLVHANLRMLLDEQIPLTEEQDAIQVPWEAWTWHAFRGSQGEKAPVLIADVQPHHVTLRIGPYRHVAHMAFYGHQ